MAITEICSLNNNVKKYKTNTANIKLLQVINRDVQNILWDQINKEFFSKQ